MDNLTVTLNLIFKPDHSTFSVNIILENFPLILILNRILKP